MMNAFFRYMLPAAVLLSAVSVRMQADGRPLEIWFDSPCSLRGSEVWTLPSAGTANPDPEWESSSLPLGNGFIGANVMGSIEAERITLNEKTLWHGGPAVSDDASFYWDVNRKSAGALKKIRRAFAGGKPEMADSLTRLYFTGKAPYEKRSGAPFRFGSFTTMGEIRITTGHAPERISGYRRSLSLDSAVASVSYCCDSVRCSREFFISYPDNVMVIRFRSGGKQRLVLEYSPNPESSCHISGSEGGMLRYSGRLMDNGMEFALGIMVFPSEGTAKAEDGKLVVEDSDDIVFVLAADTGYRMNPDPDFSDPYAYYGEDPDANVLGWLHNAAAKGYDALLSRHLADYRNLFCRVDMELSGRDMDSQDTLCRAETSGSQDALPAQGLSYMPTPDRLARYRGGCPDPGLEILLFQFGRYLLISSSRQGSMPANLQGIWHNGTDGPWHVDYHNNINLQMNYWPALPAALEECQTPLNDYIRMLEKPGSRVAWNYFRARGWTASISSNIFGFASPLDSPDMTWNLIYAAGPWLALHLWDYYEYTCDRDWLAETGYPLIKGSACFMADCLWKRPGGIYTACPSSSPEHGPVDEGATFVHAVAREILSSAITAAEILGTDSREVRKWKKVLAGIPPYRTGRYGQLMEWSRDIDDPDDNHRHVNHLFGLHPGRTVTPEATPSLAEAARVVLEHRGDISTGWSMAWKLNMWARLHDGERAYMLYRALLGHGVTDNLWCIHPPFQIDGNFGGTAGVIEMLLQSHEGLIRLLPALPSAWPDGKVSGLRARGGFEIDIVWHDGRLSECTVRSLAGNPCRLSYEGAVKEFPTRKGQVFRVDFR